MMRCQPRDFLTDVYQIECKNHANQTCVYRYLQHNHPDWFTSKNHGHFVTLSRPHDVVIYTAVPIEQNNNTKSLTRAETRWREWRVRVHICVIGSMTPMQCTSRATPHATERMQHSTFNTHEHKAIPPCRGHFTRRYFYGYKSRFGSAPRCALGTCCKIQLRCLRALHRMPFSKGAVVNAYDACIHMFMVDCVRTGQWTQKTGLSLSLSLCSSPPAGMKSDQKYYANCAARLSLPIAHLTTLEKRTPKCTL